MSDYVSNDTIGENMVLTKIIGNFSMLTSLHNIITVIKIQMFTAKIMS